MNSNVYNQTVHSLNFYIPFVTPASSHFLLQPISSLQNPTSDDFEILIEQNQQYFFFIINQQRYYPRAPT